MTCSSLIGIAGLSPFSSSRGSRIVRLGVALLALWGGACSAADSPLQIEGVEVGIAGAWKVGYWASVQVAVAGHPGGAGTLEVVAPDCEGVPVRFSTPVDAEPGGATWACLVKIGRLQGRLRVRVVCGEQTDARDLALSRLRGLPAEQELILTLGGDAGVDDAIATRQRSRRGDVSHRQLPGVAPLPESWQGLEAVDTLVVCTASGAADQLSSAQFQALRQWVVMGGHLVLSMGARAGDLLEENGRWSALAPGKLLTVRQQRFADGIESLAQAQQRLADFTMAQLDVAGRPEWLLATVATTSGQQAPAVVRRPLGFGVITCAAFDLDTPPLAGWPERGRLVSALLETAGPRSEAPSSTGSVRHVGYDDLSGQLRSALDAFPPAGNSRGVRLVAFSLVVLLMGIYLLLLGPGDYFLLRRTRRLPWTWLTFPALVAATCLLIALIHAWSKSDQMLLNQVDLVDVDVDSGAIRTTGWSQLYSPHTASINMGASATAAVASDSDVPPQPVVSWLGLPGPALGGMQSSATTMLVDDPYEILLQGDHRGVGQLPMQTASTRSFSIRWWDRSQFAAGRVSRLYDREGVLRGTLTNPLAVDLSDCVLLYGGWSHRFDGGKVAAGESVLVETLFRRDLQWQLLRKRIRRAKTSYSHTAWDPTSRDVPRILEIMMFHDAAGGESYTRLKNRYQGFLDLSGHLRGGRAILVGRAVRPATAVSLTDGADNGADNEAGDGASDGASDGAGGQRWTFYRVVFPVASQSEGAP